MASLRQQLSDSLKTLRELITKGELILFLGEQTSCLPTDHGPASISAIEDLMIKSSIAELIAKIDEYESEEIQSAHIEGKRKDPRHRVHDVLRTLGRFAVVFTVNLDHYAEKHLVAAEDKVEVVRLDQIGQLSGNWPNKNRVLLVKCLGEASYNGPLSAGVKVARFWKHFSQYQGEESVFVERILNENTCLFIGCTKQDYQQFLDRFVIKSKRRHYWYEVISGPSRLEENGQLVHIMSDMVLAEFAQYLTPGNPKPDIVPGKVTENSYLPTQRQEYLQFQLDLEKKATQIDFQTMQVTNALSTDELLDKVSRPSIEGMFKSDPFYGEFNQLTVDKVMAAMKGRRDNLLQLVRKGDVRVTSLFTLATFHGEIFDENVSLDKRQMAIRKYASVILECQSVVNANSSLELRLLDLNKEQEARMKGEQFAIIRLENGSDEAIAYAQPAVLGKKSVTTNLISINGLEVARKRKIFEEFRQMAFTHDESVLKITTALLQADKKLNALNPEDASKLNQLHNLQVITETDIEPGSLHKLGEGSFGTVYKATVVGQEKVVAFKVLKNLESGALDAFVKEFKTLKAINHKNVVKVERLHHNHAIKQLGIIMEYMEGGSIKDLLDKTPGKGQNEDFVRRCAKQVGGALEHLHGQKIIHRDVKADNVFLSGDLQTFKIGDFGLAREAATYQTKTLNRGAYRYMAPEVQKTGKYSYKVDVYSYGLMLLEVVTGETAFSQIVQHKDVYTLQGLGQLDIYIPDSVGPDTKALIVKCTQHDSKSRPNMSEVMQFLNSKVDSTVRLVEFNRQTLTAKGVTLVCLGTGKGATAITRGGPSSSFVIFNEGSPLLLVDLGLGVMMSYREYIGQDKLPPTVFITHNHTDHAGELPVSLIVFYQMLKKKIPDLKSSPLTVISGPEVIPRLTQHRMHEALSMHPDVNTFATWISLDPKDKAIPIDKSNRFTLKTFKSQHGEVGYGFVLYYDGHPILGYSGDSGYVEELYEEIYQAETVVVDARQEGTVEHAGFDDVRKFSQKKKHSRLYITGYGMPDEFDKRAAAGLVPLETGERYILWPLGTEDTPRDSGDTYPTVDDAI